MKILTTKSKTINWGHVQMILGSIGSVLVFVTPELMPDLPKWVYTGAIILGGLITYWLRNNTHKPMSHYENSEYEG